MRGPAWLLSELPELQRRGVIDADTADRLHAHYADAPAGTSWGRVLIGVLGALLVGLGLILIVAQNWDAWPHSLRLFVSLAPLALGQLACLWAVTRAQDRVLWTESSAVFTLAAFAAALALVGQLYHFPGDLGRYLLTCALAGLPLVYLLNASLVAVICAMGFAGWTLAHDVQTSTLATSLAFLTLLPHALLAWRRNPGGPRAQWLLVAGVITYGGAMLGALSEYSGLGWLWLALVAGTTWLALDRTRGWGARWLIRLAMAALALLVLLASWRGFWTGRMFGYGHVEVPAGTDFLVIFAVGAVLALLLLRTLRPAARQAGDAMSAPLAVLIVLPALALLLALGFDTSAMAQPLAALASLYLLLLGLLLVRDGLRRGQAGTANAGLLLVAVLVMVRFFDTEISFALRGLAFIVIGLAFLGASVWLRRRLQARSVTGAGA